MPIRPIHTLLALKAMSLAPDLKANDRRVGVALIEHFNRKTGRCDPSLERLARLLGISTRTVIRSVERLERAGLFRKARHGGYFNRNSYEPVWSKLWELEAAWRVKFNESKQSRTSNVSHAPCQPRHIHTDSAVTQTCQTNLLKETCRKRWAIEERRSSSIVKPLSQSSTDAARAAAEGRWTQAVHDNFVSQPVTHGEVISFITAEMHAAATDAEMRKRGAGFAYIMSKLRTPLTPAGSNTEVSSKQDREGGSNL